MVLTVRTLADNLAALPDNSSGAITPAVRRDVVVSQAPQMAQISMHETALETSIALTNTFYEVTLTGATISEISQVIAGSNDFDMPAVGRLRSLSPTIRHCHVMATISFVGAGNNIQYSMRLAKNGVTSNQSDVHRFVATGADVGSIAIHWMTKLDTNDYISIFVSNLTSADNITAISANIQIISMLM